MNATGESDMNNYYDYIDGLRENQLRPIMERLLPIMAPFRGMSHKRERASDPPDAFFMDEEGRLFRFSLRIDAPYSAQGT